MFSGNISDNWGNSIRNGGIANWTIPAGEPVTVYFSPDTPYPANVDHYELTTQNGQIRDLPSEWPINNPQNGDTLHVKCLDEDGNYIM